MEMKSTIKKHFALGMATAIAMPLFGAGCGVAAAAPKPSFATAPAGATKLGDRHHDQREAGHVYRLDFVVASNNPASATGGPAAGAFTMTLEEGHGGEIRSAPTWRFRPAEIHGSTWA